MQEYLIEVRRSAVHGLGVFARRDLPSGAVVGVYTGRRYTPKQARRLRWHSPMTYLFLLSDGTVIDGAQGGNATRHLNHACEPNCEAVEVGSEQGRLSVEMRTTQTVLAGEELFIDYALVLDSKDDPSEYPCACRAMECRGTLAAGAGHSDRVIEA